MTTHEAFMREALLEGKRALPACLPNPPVGCVLVQGGQIIARGHTQPPFHPHAEAMALSLVEGDLTGVTAYVTLEPCSFQGRTPSCALALIERGVGEVHVAMLDPHPKNQGAGIALLRDANIHVTIGLCAALAAQDLTPYLSDPINDPTSL